MFTHLTKRALGALFSILGTATIVFVLLRFTTDPVAVLLPAEATLEDAANMRERLGLDQPMAVQYAEFLRGIFTGDMGQSFRFDQPVVQMIVQRLPATMELVLLSILVALALSVPIGILCAYKRDTVVDFIGSVFAFFGFAVPSFWLGLMLIIVFSVRLGWFPTSGTGSWMHLVLPVITLATWPLGQFTRIVRSEMLEILSEDYVRTARAKGVRTSLVLWKHAFRNASFSLVTMVGLSFGGLLGGAIVTETVFAWPGMGRLVMQALSNRDFPLIQASVVYFALVFVVVNILVDAFYTVLDPRIRFG